jgi:Na+-translocating ferredoxin:NAD+ oxidoreductase RnfA subunit
MQNLLTYFAMALTAAAAENAVFARALGLNRFTLLLNSRRQGILYGVTMTFMLVLTAFPVSLINYYLLDIAFSRAIRTPLYLISVLSVYLLTYFASKRFFPKLFKRILPALPVSTFNTALFGALNISALQRFSFFQTTGYALGTGLGYTVALLVVYYARKRLAISPVPKAFQGLPILLVYIGLLSLAIYGLTGHGLSV